MFSGNESYSMSHPSGTLSSNKFLYQENESLEGPPEDVSLVEEHSGREEASIESGSLGEDRGDLVGEEPRTEEEAPVPWKEG